MLRTKWVFRPYAFGPDRMGIFGVCLITSDCGQPFSFSKFYNRFCWYVIFSADLSFFSIFFLLLPILEQFSFSFSHNFLTRCSLC